MRRALLLLGALWSGPTTLLGVLLAGLLGATPYRFIRGGVWQWRSRWGFWRWLHASDFTATTFGLVTVVSPALADDETTQKHEAVHTFQAFVCGPLFLPVYGLLSLWALARGLDVYRGNPFEVAAYKRQSGPGWPI